LDFNFDFIVPVYKDIWNKKKSMIFQDPLLTINMNF